MIKYVLSVMVAALFLSSAVVLVSAIPSNYNVTSNYHGVDAPLGVNVVVTATTTDSSIYQVTFVWRNAADEVVFTDVVAVSGGSAQSTHQPDSVGDWGVQALFQGPDGTTKEGVTYVVQIRATSFFVVPEYVSPVLGICAFFSAYIVFKRRALFKRN